MKVLRVGLLLALAACNDQVPTPAPTTAAATAVASAASPTAPPAKPSSPSPSASAATAEESQDGWLVAGKGGVELAVIELRTGKPPVATFSVEGNDAAALKTKLDEIGGPKGIPLDMHLPPESGQGRGAYGTQIVKYDDRLYRHALKIALEPDFDVKEVTTLTDPLPPPGLKQLKVSRSGEQVGTIDFTSTPPKVTLQTDKVDGETLTRHLEHVQELGALRVRYQEPKGSVETLVTAEAKPGDATYAETVVLYMMVKQYYLARHAYKLDFTE